MRMDVRVPQRRGRNLGQGQVYSCLNPCHPCFQCLRPEDVAEAVIYVLSTPPHVQVSVALAAYPLARV